MSEATLKTRCRLTLSDFKQQVSSFPATAGDDIISLGSVIYINSLKPKSPTWAGLLEGAGKRGFLEAVPTPTLSVSETLSSEQLQGQLGGLVGLRQHGLRGLLQDLVSGQVGALHRHIHVSHPRFGSRRVFHVGGQVLGGIF